MKTSILAGAAMAAVLPFCVATAANAADDNSNTGTLEVGYTYAGYDVDGIGKVNANTLHARGGLQFNKTFGAEMEVAWGLGSDSVNVLGTSEDFKQKWQIGMYVDAYLPVGAHSDLIGRVGYSRTRMTISGPGGSRDGDQKGAALGVGFRTFPGGGKNGFRADYTHFFYDDDVKGDLFSIGYVRKF